MLANSLVAVCLLWLGFFSMHMPIKKIAPIFIVLAVVSIFIFNFLYPGLFKVTDPVHPGFSAERFRVEDYHGDQCRIRQVLSVMFPIGTDKAAIDTVLLKTAHSYDEKRNEAGFMVHYKFHPKSGYRSLFPVEYRHNITVDFNYKKKVTDIRMSGKSAYKQYKNCK
jgi:hypothetical protein